MRSILRSLIAAAAAAPLVLAVVPGAAADGPRHPAELPRLARDATFPRCTPQDLAAAGFPDHLHEWHWPGWVPPVGTDGRPYGPGTLCVRGVPADRPDLDSGDAAQRLGPWILLHNPAYESCDILTFMEVLDLAQRTVTGLLDLAPADSLVVVNPDNTSQYRELSGLGTWRLYRRQGGRALIQPIGTLQARTLDGHAAFMLAADWTLDSALPADLPPWLHHGLVGYLAEDGANLVSYMGEFRPQGPLLLRPAIVDAVLAGEPDRDPGRDRERYRKACYSAFLMAWEMVENRGGLDALRTFLHLVRDGLPLDEASRRVYGQDLTGLARSLDPVDLGEPAGLRLEPTRPHEAP